MGQTFSTPKKALDGRSIGRKCSLSFIPNGTSLIKYYSGIKKDDEKMKQYLDHLKNIGIIPITKELKRIRTEQG